jgi:uncharacterized protein YndB with AHSA1/START domain
MRAGWRVTEPEQSGPDPLRIERTFKAPIAAVFAAWTSTDMLRRWWPAGRDWETVAVEADVRVGGRVRLVVRTPAGETFGGDGRYTVVLPPHRLAFTWQWSDPSGRPGQLVDVRFTDNQDGTTTVVLVNSGISDEDRRDHGRGWQLSLDNLDDVLQLHAAPRIAPTTTERGV